VIKRIAPRGVKQVVWFETCVAIETDESACRYSRRDSLMQGRFSRLKYSIGVFAFLRDN